MTSVLAILAKVPLWAWALLLAIGVIGWQHVEVSHYKHAATSAKAEVVAVKAANVANLATIHSLQVANEAWADKSKHDAALAAAQVAASKQSDAATIDKLTQLSKKLADRVKHDAIVKNWSSVPVPTGVSILFTQGGTH